MDRIADLVRQLEPEMAPPTPDIEARRREVFLRSMVPAEQAPAHPPRRHTRHRAWFVAIGGAAAAAVVAAVVVPGSSSPSRQRVATSAALTAVTKALATTGNDIEVVQSNVPGAPMSTTSRVDLSTGACRTDTSVNGQRSLTIFVEHGKAVFIDHGLREWWTRGSEGVTCEPPTPQAIEHAVTTGDFTVAGRATVGGQPSLKLESTSTTTGAHRMTKLTTLWVNATTYLPIQSTSTGHLTEQSTFTWLPATATNAAKLAVTVPAGYRHVAAPSPSTQQGG